MSSMADDVIVADEPTSILQHKGEDLNALELSGESTTDCEVIDDATSDAEGAAVGTRHVPELSDNNDNGIATASDGAPAEDTPVDVLNVSQVVDDKEPEVTLQHTSHFDNDNIVIIQRSEPPADDEINSSSIEASEQSTTFTFHPNGQPDTLAEPTREDANEVADAAISEIRKDELPLDGPETQTPPVDADTTIVDDPRASVEEGEPPISINVGPESGVSDAVEPSKNGVGSTTGTEPLETPTYDPFVQMNRSAELLEEVVTTVLEAQEIPPTAVEPAVVAEIAEPNQGEVNQMDVEVPAVDKCFMAIEPAASTALPTDIEPELVCTATQSPLNEPKTMEELVEETVAMTEPEPETVLQLTTDAVGSEPIEESTAIAEQNTEVAESDAVEETATVANVMVTAAEPTLDADMEELAAGSITPIAVEKTAYEAIEALDQRVTPAKSEGDAHVPEIVLAPANAPTDPDPDVVPAQPEGTTVAAEAGSVAAAAEPAHVAVSYPEPVTTIETDSVAVAEPEAIAVVPETPAEVEQEPVQLEVEKTVVETVPIDIEPPSSNASSPKDPEVGFVFPDEEPHTLVTEEMVFPASDVSTLKPTEESQIPVTFEEPSVNDTSVVEEVDLVDCVAPAEEPASVKETVPVEESLLEEIVEVEKIIVAPVENIAHSECATSIESANPLESTPLVEMAIGASGSVVEPPTAHADEPEALAVQETPTSVEATDQPLPHVESPGEAAPVTEEIPVPVEDISTSEEKLSPTVEVVATSVDEDVLIAEEPLVSTSAEDTLAAEEHSAPIPVEKDIFTVEEFPIPAAPAEDIAPTVEDTLAPVPVEDPVLVIEVPPMSTTIEALAIMEEPPVSLAEEIILVVEEPTPPPAEDIFPIEEFVIPALVQEDTSLEEPLAPAEMERSEPVMVEDAPVTGEEHQAVAVEETPVPGEQPLVVEQALTTAAEPAPEATSVIEELPVPEERLVTALQEPFAVDVPLMPAELTFETAPAPEAALVTPADSMLAASSVEEIVSVAEELDVCDPLVSGRSVFVEEPAPAGSEASAFETIVSEELHGTVEIEEALVPRVETTDELKESLQAEVPMSLTEQLANEPATEESPKAPVNEEFSTEAVAESIVPEEELVAFPVQFAEDPADASTIHPEASETVKDSESSTLLAEIPDEIEEVAEQQEFATVASLSVITEIERPKSPWTPSYSVTNQGPGIPVEEPASTYEGEDGTVLTHSRTPEIIVDEAAVINPETADNIAVATQSQGDADSAAQPAEVALDEMEEAHPKSPWTPSYSVTVQGHVTENNEELDDDFEQLPPSAVQPVEAAEEVEELPVSQETLVFSDVSSSTEVIADTYTVLSETLNDTVELAFPAPATEAEAPQYAFLEQVTTAVEAEPSGVIPPEPANVEEELEIELGSFIVEDESAHLDPTESVEERSRSPWTPSYSVTGLESANASDNGTVTDEDESVEQGSFIIENPPIATVEDRTETKPELLTPVDDPVVERPKSPWTPSYSVTNQGPTEETEELDELEQLPDPIAIIATDEEPIPPVLITETRASVDRHDTAEEAQETPQTFPILEGPQRISKKPSLSAVDELNVASATDVAESTTLRIDIPATNEDGRKRLESTTSSRFFPGGWFSSSPKVPEEGRTSLDVAAGEFINQSSVENTPTTALPSAVEEDREKKSRWCTIM